MPIERKSNKWRIYGSCWYLKIKSPSWVYRAVVLGCHHYWAIWRWLSLIQQWNTNEKGTCLTSSVRCSCRLLCWCSPRCFFSHNGYFVCWFCFLVALVVDVATCRGAFMAVKCNMLCNVNELDCWLCTVRNCSTTSQFKLHFFFSYYILGETGWLTRVVVVSGSVKAICTRFL